MANDRQSQPPAIVQKLRGYVDRGKTTSPGRQFVDVLRYSGVKRLADAARFGPRGKQKGRNSGR